jgi:predicted AAA+ superfamily ATPase
MKQYLHRGMRPACFYWRDNTGNEIDLLLEEGGRIIPVEIKSGRTIKPDFFRNLEFFNRISGNPPELGHIIHGGDTLQKRTQGVVTGWKHMPVWSELS